MKAVQNTILSDGAMVALAGAALVLLVIGLILLWKILKVLRILSKQLEHAREDSTMQIRSVMDLLQRYLRSDKSANESAERGKWPS